MRDLFAQLNAICPMPEGLDQWLYRSVQIRKLDRKDFLAKAGKVNRNVYFVRSGLLRIYHVTGGKEISFSFARENDLCVCLNSFFDGQEGVEYIRALKRTTVYYIDYEQLQSAYAEFPELNFPARKLAEDYLLLLYRRVAGMWMQKAVDKYWWTKRNHPWLLERVPDKYLSSYMGMTPVMLSRLKKVTPQY
jgi:CRP/FNR family transcriptional regulator, anaerobic regulatory protein